MHGKQLWSTLQDTGNDAPNFKSFKLAGGISNLTNYIYASQLQYLWIHLKLSVIHKSDDTYKIDISFLLYSPIAPFK